MRTCAAVMSITLHLHHELTPLAHVQIFMFFLAHAYGTVVTRNHSGGSIPSTVHDGSSHAKYAELIVDQSWTLLWPCMVPWVLFEGVMSYAWLHNVHGKYLCVAILLCCGTSPCLLA